MGKYIDKLIRDFVPQKFFWGEYETEEPWEPDLLEPYPDDASFEAALDEKAFEELWEVMDAETDAEMFGEIGDLLTVLKAKVALRGGDWNKDVLAVEHDKTEAKGGFDQRLRCVGTLPEWYH